MSAVLYYLSATLIAATDEHQNYTAIDMDILGSIDIYVYRSVLVGVMKKKQSSYELPPDIGHVSERSKMAGTHCVA